MTARNDSFILDFAILDSAILDSCSTPLDDHRSNTGEAQAHNSSAEYNPIILSTFLQP